MHTVTDIPTHRTGTKNHGINKDGSSWSADVSSTRKEWQRDDLHIVLVHPQIPQNTGNIARTSAATAVSLHLVEPLGFEVTDKSLKRAGLDYWDSVHCQTHSSWRSFYNFWLQLPQPKRLVAFTVYSSQYYAGPEFKYEPGDWLLFGAETTGLPLEAHEDIHASGGALVKIPIATQGHVRSLNLAVSVGVATFEALRQLDMGRHYVEPKQSPSIEEVDRSRLQRMEGGTAPKASY
jgi:tRNA (cytidine/uridine-2'-O-)-methyltransferase